MHNPSRPGELLREWMNGAQISTTSLAAQIGVTRARLTSIVNGHSVFTAEMDLRLHQALGSRQGLWLDMQIQRNLWALMQAKPPRIKRLR